MSIGKIERGYQLSFVVKKSTGEVVQNIAMYRDVGIKLNRGESKQWNEPTIAEDVGGMVVEISVPPVGENPYTLTTTIGEVSFDTTMNRFSESDIFVNNVFSSSNLNNTFTADLTKLRFPFTILEVPNVGYYFLLLAQTNLYGSFPYLYGAVSGDATVFDLQSGPQTTYGFPYGDGASTSQGGQGDMTDNSEPIEIDSKPLLTTGEFLRVYKLTATDLSALQAKLISNGFLDGLIAKLRTDAMDYIVGLNAIPISASNVASSTIKIANLDTEITASYLSWYIEDIDFGEIALTEYFQTFMDYSPYTKLSVYIPYCGIVPLNVDNFMNDKISMKCRVDMLTGQFVVFVSNSVGVVTTVSGNCAYQLPIRANDYNRLVTSGLGLLGGIVGTAGALATGNIPLAIGAGLGTIGGLVATSQAMTKPDVTSKGSLGGNYGLLGNRTPYLIIQRPTISVPPDYGKTIGYMSRITAKLGDLAGYTVVEEIHLEHISATDDEKKLIENALKSGVIL